MGQRKYCQVSSETKWEEICWLQVLVFLSGMFHMLFSIQRIFHSNWWKIIHQCVCKHRCLLDCDFISAIASLVCHNNHSLAPSVPINAGKDVPQLSHATFPNSVMTIRDYKALPSGIKCIVAMMHTQLHYVVMDDTKTIKIFDGLHWDLLDWKDHIIRALCLAE